MIRLNAVMFGLDDPLVPSYVQYYDEVRSHMATAWYWDVRILRISSLHQHDKCVV